MSTSTAAFSPSRTSCLSHARPHRVAACVAHPELPRRRPRDTGAADHHLRQHPVAHQAEQDVWRGLLLHHLHPDAHGARAHRPRPVELAVPDGHLPTAGRTPPDVDHAGPRFRTARRAGGGKHRLRRGLGRADPRGGGGAFNLVLPLQFGWFVLSLALSVGAMFGIGLCIAAFAGSARIALVIGGLLFYPLAFLAGMYGPLTVYPVVVSQIAKWAPTGAAFNALHDSLGGHFPGWTSLGVLAAYAVVFSAIAVRWFRWDVERDHIRSGRILALLTLTLRVTLPGHLSGEQVTRALSDRLPPHFTVEPATRFRGRLFGLRTEPAGPDVILVSSGVSGLGRAEVTVVRTSGDTRVRIRSGGQVLYSALSVASKVRRVLQQDLGDVTSQ